MTINTTTTITTCLSTVKSKVAPARRSRDKQNDQTKEWTVKRNGLNSQVKSKISEVKSYQKARDNHNQEVRRYKKMRNQFQDDYKKMAGDKQDPNLQSDDDIEQQLKQLIEKQQNAHEAMKREATLGQQQHELMLEQNQRVDSIRKQAQSAHEKLRASKKKADQLHDEYMVLLRCQHACQDILRAMDKRDTEHLNQDHERMELTKKIRSQSSDSENFTDVFENGGL